ncbi:hypothetical protein HDU83_006316 [Entophlyctis luteolus]|nr:hypothetical protein HDU83_006316 [Entophlyctis luteolus]
MSSQLSPQSTCSAPAADQCPALSRPVGADSSVMPASLSSSQSASPEPPSTVCIIPSPPAPTYIPSVFQFLAGKKVQQQTTADCSPRPRQHAPYPTRSSKLSAAQTAALEDAFAMNQAPVTKEYTQLAQALGMTRADVMTWFRRKRVETPNDVRAVMQHLQLRERKQLEDSIRRVTEERSQASRIQISSLLL